MLRDKIWSKEPGILTYGITPPKETHTPERIQEIAQKHIERISSLDIDGLILYDVQDESRRNEQERPFPYLKTIDPDLYSNNYINSIRVPKIIYRCVGKYTKEQLTEWISYDQDRDRFSVFVGASSSVHDVKHSLHGAYRLSRETNSNLTVGGVVIPERHLKTNKEHLRLIHKANEGSKFFVSQAVYNIEASKNLLSDYFYYCQTNQIDMVPILFNLSPCGSLKTLDFMKWLGISVPVWLENELKHSNDILDKSIQLSIQLFQELFEYGLDKGIPVGCSVESVSTRKVEIEASIQLTKDIRQIIDKKK